jgi:transcriptional regulator with XRE-family HTH domain
VSQTRQPTEFGLYLIAALRSAGFTSISAFARAAGRDPSVVHRWIYGITAPSAKVLAEVAPVLRVPEADLIARAYPGGAADLPAAPIPRELAALIDAYAALDPAARKELLERAGWLTEWADMRRRLAERSEPA